MARCQKFTPEFRAKSVEHYLSSGKFLSEVSTLLGVNEEPLAIGSGPTASNIQDTSLRNAARWIGPQHKNLQKELAEA